MALDDAQRTLGLVRLHAAKWKVDPHKIGVLGFSAGGHLVAAISTHFRKRLYPGVDEADDQSCRPDFGVVLYPGHLTWEEISPKLRRDVPVAHDTPPQFIVQAEDDPVDDVENSLAYYVALARVGVSAEMHLYPRGGHAFGLRPRAEFPITTWPRAVEAWLQTIGMISR
jgi:acetyl esterase/lipase